MGGTYRRHQVNCLGLLLEYVRIWTDVVQPLLLVVEWIPSMDGEGSPVPFQGYVMLSGPVGSEREHSGIT